MENGLAGPQKVRQNDRMIQQFHSYVYPEKNRKHHSNKYLYMDGHHGIILSSQEAETLEMSLKG